MSHPIVFTLAEWVEDNNAATIVMESHNYTGHIPHKGDHIAIINSSLPHKPKSAYTVIEVQFYYNDSCQLAEVVLVMKFLRSI